MIISLEWGGGGLEAGAVMRWPDVPEEIIENARWMVMEFARLGFASS